MQSHSKQKHTEMSRRRGKTETRGLRPSPRSGICEAAVWQFTAAAAGLQEQPEVQLVAAESLHQALSYMQKSERDFDIRKVECLGLIPILSGSPLD
jgi:uncharacterized protein (DUF2237 family)